MVPPLMGTRRAQTLQQLPGHVSGVTIEPQIVTATHDAADLAAIVSTSSGQAPAAAADVADPSKHAAPIHGCGRHHPF